MKGFLRKYLWYVLASILAYAAATAWLFLATEEPQQVPFEYQVF